MYMLTQEMEEVCRDLLLRLSDKLVSGKRSGSHLAPTLGFFSRGCPGLENAMVKQLNPCVQRKIKLTWFLKAPGILAAETKLLWRIP